MSLQPAWAEGTLIHGLPWPCFLLQLKKGRRGGVGSQAGSELGPAPPLMWPHGPLDTLLSDPSPAPRPHPSGLTCETCEQVRSPEARDPGGWSPPVVWTLLLHVMGALGTHGHWFPYGSLWDVMGLQAFLGGEDHLPGSQILGAVAFCPAARWVSSSPAFPRGLFLQAPPLTGTSQLPGNSTYCL